MAKKFIDNIRIVKKEIVALNLNKLEERTKNLAVEIGFELSDNDSGCQFSANDTIKLSVSLKIIIRDKESLLEAEEENKHSLFEGNITIDLLIKFLKDVEFENSITKDYSTELLSLVYDDLRLVTEANINRTSFRGLFLPADFRDVIPN